LTWLSTSCCGPGGSEVTADTIDEVMIQESYDVEKERRAGLSSSRTTRSQQLNYFYISSFVDQQVNGRVRRPSLGRHQTAVHRRASGGIPTIANGGVRIDAEHGRMPQPARGIEGPARFRGLNIKPGLKWSDGETLDLNDVRYTWEWNMTRRRRRPLRRHRRLNIIDRFDVV
jgi:hypothetical protein